MSIDSPASSKQQGIRIPQEIVGKYKLLKHLGKGAFANVYLATLVSNASSSPHSAPMQEKSNSVGLMGLSGSSNTSSTGSFKAKLASAFTSLSMSPPRGGKQLVQQQQQLTALKICQKSDIEACESLKNGSKTLLALKEFARRLRDGPSLHSIPFETAIALKGYQDKIVKVVDYFETDAYICLCLELIHGKELFECIMDRTAALSADESSLPSSLTGSDSIEKATKLEASYVRSVMKSLLEGVSFIHAAGFAHGDIKLENIMILDSLLSKPGCPEIKIIDFGLSTICKDDEETIEGMPRGSEHYFAPEAVMTMPRNPRKLDIWACGVVMFALLTLRMPFDLDTITARLNPGTRRSLARKIAMGSVRWSEEEVNSISKESYDLVMLMLMRDPAERPSAQDLLKHPFFGS